MTGTEMILNVDIAYNLLSQLSKRGTGIFVYDLGTGYAAFNNLKNFPVNSLKIDRSFVRDLASDPSDSSIAKTIVAIPDGLNLSIIAEGMETPAKWE
ncbi:EAL domain-containing protein [Microcoleus sp. herbarium5]|uniref:EAL domain-containing protein n=1 Tax=Microcoleus sp. herbarium5 TaxID=3055434 RepID=UPI002FD6FF73